MITAGITLKGATSGMEKLAQASQILGGLKITAQLAKDAFRVAAEQIAGMATEAARFRQTGDAGRRTLEDFHGATLRTRVAIGDALLPAITGTIRALGLAEDGMERWIRANRVAIGLRIADELDRLGRVLVSGVATGAVYATRAVTGLRVAVAFVGIAANAMATTAAGAFASVIDAGATAARLVGKDGLAASLAAASAEVRILGEAMQEQSDVWTTEIDRELEAQRELEASIRSYEATALRAIPRVTEEIRKAAHEQVRSVRAMTDAEKARAAAGSTARAEKDGDAMVALYERMELAHRDLTAAAVTSADAARQGLTESRYAYVTALEQMQARDQQFFDDAGAAAAAFTMRTGQDLISLATSADDAADAFGDIAAHLAKMVAQAAIFAGLKSLFALLGPVTGGGSGFLGGFLGALLGFSRGGHVRAPARFAGGGTATGPGIDWVPALLTPGEGIASVPSMRAWRDRGVPPPELGPPGRSAGAGAAPVSIALSFTSPSGLPTDADFETMVLRRLVPVLRRAKALGSL